MLSRILLLLSLLPLAFAGGAHAQTVPSEIKIGELYASSGPFASISMPVYDGFKLWVQQKNAEGGVFVKPYNKKIPIRLISYDDQSSTATAATLYNQLITQDKVDLLVADSGSVLTSVAVPIAKEHKQFLFNVSGTGGTFFTKDNPYIALMSVPVSTIWPKYIADFLNDVGVKEGIKTVAVLYATNDFTTTQANAVKGFIKQGGKLDIVYDQGVPTNTPNYTVLLNNIAAAKPDAVVELGYVGNDIAFLRNLQDSGYRFRFLFTIYSGLETHELLKNAGAQAMSGVFSYVPAAQYRIPAEFRAGAVGIPCSLGEGVSRRVGCRMGLQRGAGLHDGAGGRADACHHRKPGSAGDSRRGVRSVRQAEDADGHVRAGHDRRADRRDHTARPAAAGRQGRAESGRGLSAGIRQGPGRAGQVMAPAGPALN